VNYTLAQLQALAVSVGFPDPALAAAVAMAESGGDPCANGDPHNSSSCSNDYSSTSFGLWQIHVTAHPQYNSSQLKAHDRAESGDGCLTCSRHLDRQYPTAD
jgi:Lysozyme like domain